MLITEHFSTAEMLCRCEDCTDFRRVAEKAAKGVTHVLGLEDGFRCLVRSSWPNNDVSIPADNIVELCHALEILRDIMGRPITVTSGLRCDRHNDAVGGGKSSQHLYGRAADIVVAGWDVEDLAKTAGHVVRNGELVFTGIGTYEKSGFVHVDTRPIPEEGARVTWREK